MLDAIGIAGSALGVHRKWLDALADNIANVNTAKPTSGDAFQARYIVAQADPNGQGVAVAGAAFGSKEGRVTYDPSNPVADDKGYVRMPDVDLAQQMSSLILAQRGYQANAAVVDRAKTIYEAALQIGK
jgi:flagellar basal-body rod protein FlgC